MKYSIAIAEILCSLGQSNYVRKTIVEYEGDIDTEE